MRLMNFYRIDFFFCLLKVFVKVIYYFLLCFYLLFFGFFWVYMSLVSGDIRFGEKIENDEGNNINELGW